MRNTKGRNALLGALVAAGTLCFGSSAVLAAGLVASMTSGDPNTQVTFTVSLDSSDGAMVAGTQNDLAFDPVNIPVAPRTNGRPDCTVNPDIEKGGTSFAFRPSGCTGSACNMIRALVLATNNVDPIPNGSVLYTCKVNIADGTAGMTFPLTMSGVILSDPAGNQIPNPTATNGSVMVIGGIPPTATPTMGAVECVPPALQIDMVTTEPGTTVDVEASLLTGGVSIAGTQNDITFDNINAPIIARANGRPDCAVNPDIEKGGTSFAFRPSGCTGSACTMVRALVLATDNVDPIPDGSVLYTCKVTVSGTGTFPLTTSGVIFSDPAGGQVPGAKGCDGSVGTGGPVTPTTPPTGPTNTPTPTATATQAVTPATNTPTATRTNTPPPTNTPTAIRTNTSSSQPTPVPFDDDGGCQISTTGSSSAGWLLLIPAVGLLAMRRRRR